MFLTMQSVTDTPPPQPLPFSASVLTAPHAWFLFSLSNIDLAAPMSQTCPSPHFSPLMFLWSLIQG